MKRSNSIYTSMPEFDGGGVYCIENTVRREFYIGSSKHIRSRLFQHASFIRSGTGNSGLRSAYLDGEPLYATVIEIIDNPCVFELRDRERWHVDHLSETGFVLLNRAPVPPGKQYYDGLLHLAECRNDIKQMESLNSYITQFCARSGNNS